MSTENGANSVVLRPMPVSTVSAPLTSCRYSHRRPAPAPTASDKPHRRARPGRGLLRCRPSGDQAPPISSRGVGESVVVIERGSHHPTVEPRPDSKVKSDLLLRNSRSGHRALALTANGGPRQYLIRSTDMETKCPMLKS